MSDKSAHSYLILQADSLLGRALAHELAGPGIRLTLIGSNREELLSLAARIAESDAVVRPVALDKGIAGICAAEQVRRLVEDFGRLDGVIFCSDEALDAECEDSCLGWFEAAIGAMAKVSEPTAFSVVVSHAADASLDRLFRRMTELPNRPRRVSARIIRSDKARQVAPILKTSPGGDQIMRF